MAISNNYLIVNKLFRIISFTVFICSSNAIREQSHIYLKKPFQEQKKSPFAIKNLNLQPLRNIDIKRISSRFKSTVPTSTVGLVMASWTINSLLFTTVRRMTHMIDRKHKINIDVKVPNNSTNNSANTKVQDPLTESEVIKCQREWSSAIELISAAYLDGGDFVNTAIKT